MENKEPLLNKTDNAASKPGNSSLSDSIQTEIKESNGVFTVATTNTDKSAIQNLSTESNKSTSSIDDKTSSPDQISQNKTEPTKNTINTSGKQQKYNWLIVAIIVIASYVLLANLLSPMVGLRLAILSNMANNMSVPQYVALKTDYADYLCSVKQYNQAVTIYTNVINQLKATNADKQLLGFVDLRLAQLLIQRNQSNEMEKLIKEALPYLGKPNAGTPAGLVETLRSLGMHYVNSDDPHTGGPLIWTAARFWKTGPTTQSEGNTFADLGYALGEQSDWAASYKAYEHAYSITESWGNANYNVYRLGGMGLAKANMEQPQEAAGLLQRAIEMDEKIDKDQLYYGRRYVEPYAGTLIESNQLDKVEDVIAKYNLWFSPEAYYKTFQQLANAYVKDKQPQKAIRILGNIVIDYNIGKDVPNIRQVKRALFQLTHNKVPAATSLLNKG